LRAAYERCRRQTPTDYLDHLATRPNHEAELRLLLNEITIGETCMFRNPQQLDALRAAILPQIMQTKGATGYKRLRFWSAGCSTGEEPYTLAMFLLEESDKLLAGWTFEILVTDLNDDSLSAARPASTGNTPCAIPQKRCVEPISRCAMTRNDRSPNN
jgi:chemotaxis protein methyltransferase CheR